MFRQPAAAMTPGLLHWLPTRLDCARDIPVAVTPYMLRKQIVELVHNHSIFLSYNFRIAACIRLILLIMVKPHFCFNVIPITSVSCAVLQRLNQMGKLLRHNNACQ